MNYILKHCPEMAKASRYYKERPYLLSAKAMAKIKAFYIKDSCAYSIKNAMIAGPGGYRNINLKAIPATAKPHPMPNKLHLHPSRRTIRKIGVQEPTIKK
jgi:hypothetical protein